LPTTIRSCFQVRRVENPDFEVARDWLLQQGLDAAEIDEYLQYAHSDAQLALQLKQQDFINKLGKFRELIKQYLGSQIAIVGVLSGLKELDNGEIRLMIKNTLQSFVHHQLESSLSGMRKKQLLELLNLINHSNFVLQIEENNLNLQLQLEDVLISLKQILNRGKSHARTKSGDLVT